MICAINANSKICVFIVVVIIFVVLHDRFYEIII